MAHSEKLYNIVCECGASSMIGKGSRRHPIYAIKVLFTPHGPYRCAECKSVLRTLPFKKQHITMLEGSKYIKD